MGVDSRPSLLVILVISTVACAPKGRVSTYNMTGEYKYHLIYNIDNSNNSGSITKVVNHGYTTAMSYREYKTGVASASATTSNNLKASVFDIVSNSLSGDLKSGVESAYDVILTHHTESSAEYQRNETIVIQPQTRLKLYRLVFHGPGVTYETANLVSEQEALSAVKFDVTVQQHYFFKGFDVVYDQVPSNVIDMARGNGHNINQDFPGRKVFLVPVWTKLENESATGIRLRIQVQKNASMANLVEGAGEAKYRYLEIMRDYEQSMRIIDVALYKDRERISAAKAMEYGGWTHWSNNIMINRDNGKHYYVVYKVKPVVHTNTRLC